METTSTLLNKVTHAFFRDEYQEDSGNLPHIHGLVKLERGDLDNKEFFDFLGQLQKNSVGEIIPTTEIESFCHRPLYLFRYLGYKYLSYKGSIHF
jgi:hypothetical protein